ncbi:MAG: alpha/beta fold hydrolase [Acidimicrobiales bacterium]
MPLTESDAAQLFRDEPDGFLDVGAGEVAHRKVGTGPDVLFIHGWPVSGATWRKLLPHLVDHVTCHIIDLPSAGSSRFDAETPMSIQQHITSVQRVVDLLGVEQIAVVGHNSGGMIARHALAGDPRLRSMGLINTEPPDPSWRFRSFIAARRLPGLSAGFGWVAGQPKIRATKFVFGDTFADRSLLDGEFAEFVFEPLHSNAVARDAAVRLLRSFDMTYVTGLPATHRKLDVPVKLVWGDHDPFFPVDRAKAMVSTFPDASIDVIEGAGLFSHEEAPVEVAASLLPVLGTSPQT